MKSKKEHLEITGLELEKYPQYPQLLEAYEEARDMAFKAYWEAIEPYWKSEPRFLRLYERTKDKASEDYSAATNETLTAYLEVKCKIKLERGLQSEG